MKKLLAIILFWVISFNSLVSIGVVSHYYLNQKYYAEVLCINKDNKSMGCDGKCQLKKELAAVNTTTENAEKPMSIPFKFESLSYLFLKENLTSFFSNQKEEFLFFYLEKNCIHKDANVIYRPPIV